MSRLFSSRAEATLATWPPGHIVYGIDGTLWAAGIDLGRLELTSEPVPVLEGVVTKATGAADFGVSRDGSLVYLEGSPRGLDFKLVWVDRQGNAEVLGAPPRAYFFPRLSPDATVIRDQENDIWIWDLARETLTRLTFDPGPDQWPSWSPDGLRVAFSSGVLGNLFWKAADGTGSVKRLAESANEQEPQAFLPDGRFLAYESDESGQSEVYVRPFPSVDEGREQVSTNGGSTPLWARNGRELFYRAAGGELMAVPVRAQADAAGLGIAFGNAGVVVDGTFLLGVGRMYDVSPEGDRFLMVQANAEHEETAALILVQNWTEELKRLVPVATGK